MEFSFDAAYLRVVHGSSSRGGQVTPHVRSLVQALVGEQSRTQLRETLALRDRMQFQSTYLLPALDLGVVETTRTDKPTSRLQRYSLTPMGRTLVARSKNEGPV